VTLQQLDYGTLHKELDTQSSRELEDLVIEAVYHVCTPLITFQSVEFF
jgi:hypothetical protein